MVKNYLRGICLIIIVSFSLLSCKTTKTVIKPVNLKKETPEFLFDRLIHQQFQADWLSAKGKLRYEDPYQSASATVNIKMKKDSLIWMNIKKLGIEAARVKITTDSIYIINRIHNEYSIHGLDYLEKRYNLPATLSMIQTLLLGNPIFFGKKHMQSTIKESFHELHFKEDGMESYYWLDHPDFFLRKMNFIDNHARRTLEFTLDDYRQIPENQNFSYLRTLELNSRETGQINIDFKFSKLEINAPKTIRFEIPERYERVE